MMQWEQLLSTKRFGMEQYHDERHDDRTEFQRDYDRLIFSAPFRRLQNKTQVFPLPGSVFVHNRLTHSLEVSCVGRSIAMHVTRLLHDKHRHLPIYIDDIGSIVAAACLAHDLGNPPFGHSGENAIGTFFSEEAGTIFRSEVTAAEWTDFTHFEGNANAFRLLTHQFGGHRKGGFALNYSTLASIVKYPYESQYADAHKQKFGFFQSDKGAYEQIANALGIVRDPARPERFARHPLVYLVEAADDICYEIMDIEDAHKLHIISTDDTYDLLLGFFEPDKRALLRNNYPNVTDPNERVMYYRSYVINHIEQECVKAFIRHEDEIMEGRFQGSLLAHTDSTCREAFGRCSDFARANIYKAREVLDVELAGYRIIYTLLDLFTDAILEPEAAYSRLLIDRVPGQYQIRHHTLSGRIRGMLDYITGMTDVYALDLYRKIIGMSLPNV